MSARADNLRRPRTRGECPPNSEPCPFVTCRYHLWLDRELDRHGAVVDFHETAAWGDEQRTCVLRQADHLGLTLDQVARVYRLTRERIRQIEADALAHCRRLATPALRELADAPAEADDHDDDTTDDTGWPERGECDESGAPEAGESDSTDQRRAGKAASELRRRRAIAAAADASPLVPCPRCGEPMRALTHTGKPRVVCGTACANAHGRLRHAAEARPMAPCPACGQPMPKHGRKGRLRVACSRTCARRLREGPVGPTWGPAGYSGDDGPPFSLATGGKRRSHCSHGTGASQATAP